ncbi:hypothetical protein Mapa_012388 [Marchantia paleacea]|nr:hypothetical protein Mapa_012388 [Marchantia paleacea]
MTKSATGEEQSVQPKRPLVRLGRQLILHVHSISFFCYAAGVVAILLLPMLAKNTYISENALMPGSGNAAFSNSDTLLARSSAEEVQKLVSQNVNVQRVVSKWLVEEITGTGADCYMHPFTPPASALSSTRFPTSSGHFKWSTSNASVTVDDLEEQALSAINVVGIIRAPQAEGNEAVVLVTPYDPDDFRHESALTLGMGLALFSRLSQALWLARDIVWLVPDSKYGVYPAVASWLEEYHHPPINHISLHQDMKLELLRKTLSEDGEFSQQLIDSQTLGDFKRAGTIATGLVYELKSGLRHGGADTITVWAEGPNGQMPNLDFINVVNSIAVYRESLQLRLETIPVIKSWTCLKIVGMVFEEINKLTKVITPSWSFALPAATYTENLATLFSSMFFQIIGLPTGAHGAFRDYQIDAITLQFIIPNQGQDYVLAKVGRHLEGVLRSVNNLLEKWHQSFFLYFLSALNKYISVGVYMIPFGLLVLSLPLQAAALCYPVKEAGSATTDVSTQSLRSTSTKRRVKKQRLEGKSSGDDSGSWLEALVLVGAVQLWAFFAALALYLISETNRAAELKLRLWLVIVAVSLLVAFSLQNFLTGSMHYRRTAQAQTQSWAVVKAVTLGITAIDLAVMSTINFPVSLIGALTLIPMCLGVFPIQHSWRYAHSQGKSVVGIAALAVGTVWTLAMSPVGLPLLIWSFYGHLLDINSENVWNFAESLLQWRSALLPHILVIHLPCAVLCLYILISRLPTQRL